MTLLLLLACTGPDKDDTGPTSGFDGAFVFTDPNNYGYTSALDVAAQDIQLAHDVTFDWSGLTTDLLGHAMDPATDVDLVWMVQFPNLTEDDVVSAILTDSLLQLDVGPYVQFDNDPADTTTALLSEFVFPPDNVIDPATEEVTEETIAGWGVDGCSAPNFAMTAGALARGMAKFATAREGHGAREDAMFRLTRAMAAHPHLVSGEGQACTELMRAMDGRVANKGGAEAGYVAIVPEKGRGIGLKGGERR